MGGVVAVGTSGVDVQGAGPAARNNWWASLAIGGKLYGVPCAADAILVFDPELLANSSSSSLGIVSGVSTRHIAQGPDKWRAATSFGGKIYGIPSQADKLLVYDVETCAVQGIDTRILATGDKKWGSCAALAGKIFGIPCNADRILIFAPDTKKVVGVSVAKIASGSAKWLTSVVAGARIYCVPCNAGSILVYDPERGSAMGIDIGHLATGALKWLSSIYFRGKIYGIPYNADCILVFDPTTHECRAINTSAVAKGQFKWISAVTFGGKIYCIPDHAGCVMVYNPETEALAGIDVSAIGTGPTKWQSAVLLGGKIYAVPHNAENMLVFDPSTLVASEVSTSGVASGSAKWSTCVALGNKVCALPYDAQQMLVHEVQDILPGGAEVTDIPSLIGRELVEDFVAAWLSEWIYSFKDPEAPCEVPSLSVDGKLVEFIVHRVYEDSTQGIRCRLGTVTADVPGFAPVLYLVFKGSSFFSDFVVNASVSPDYSPFHRAFGDNTTFVHHGAHHAIAQLRVHQWSILTQQLQESAAAGTARVVVTGHSLGGQYAFAFLLQVFLDSCPSQFRVTENSPTVMGLHPLLEGARVVAFGAPMCFGAAEGCSVRRDLAEFARERSVNYINSGDPAPRLWSELDLKQFTEYFAEWVQGQISGISRRLVDYAVGPGGLAKKAQDMLMRKDIESHMLRPAARYVHLARIRTLGVAFVPWRPLKQESVRIEDHSLLEAYLPALRSAFDPRAVANIFDEDGVFLIGEDGSGPSYPT